MTRPSEHVTGDFGTRFVAFHLPPAWVLHEYKGSEDYGIDFHVEIFSDGRPTGLEFGIQVKTVRRPLVEVSRIKVKRNSLIYALSKPYPSMIVVVSEQDRKAVYSWFHQILPIARLSDVFASKDHEISLETTPRAPLDHAGDEIHRFCEQHHAATLAWLEAAHNQHLLLDLYLNAHTALDCLLECNALDRRSDPDVVSHKSTFTITLAVVAYGLLRDAASAPDDRFGPVAHNVRGAFERFALVLERLVAPKYLDEYFHGKFPGDLYISPVKYSALYPNLRDMIVTLRDVLRSLARILAPWRDWRLGLEGLANDVITYSRSDKTGSSLIESG